MGLERITGLPDGLRTETAVALGFFDGVHLGHRAVLAAARGEGLLRTAFTFSTNGRAPGGKKDGRIYPDNLRAQLMEENGIELMVMPEFSMIADMSAPEFAGFLCGKLRAKLVCCGEDYHFSAGAGADAACLRELCGRYGCRVEIIPPVSLHGQRVSSTRIRELLREGGIGEANRLLGEPYRIEGTVEHGQRLGHTLGFPTINLPLPGNGALPLFGVYHSRTWAQGCWTDSITNIGIRPTVAQGAAPRAETFLCGYSGRLYGEPVRVQLLDFLRTERKFESIDALRMQIEQDCRARENWGKNHL